MPAPSRPRSAWLVIVSAIIVACAGEIETFVVSFFANGVVASAAALPLRRIGFGGLVLLGL